MVTGSASTSSSIPGVADDEENSRDANQSSPAMHRKSDDHIIGVTHNITLRGTLVAGMKGSPNIDLPDNVFNTFYDASMKLYPGGGASPTTENLAIPTDKNGFRAIMRMQDSLRGLFAEDGHLFEINDQNEETVMSAVVRVTGIEFSEAEAGENWTSRCDYTITLESDRIYRASAFGGEGEDAKEGGFDNLPKDIYGNEIYLREASENWSIEPQEEGSKAMDLAGLSSATSEPQSPFFEDHPYTFRITHTINAVGKRVYGGNAAHQTGSYSNPAGGSVTSEAWEEAKKWVQTKLGMTENKKKELLRGMGITGANSIQLDNPGSTQDEFSQNKYGEYNRLRTENIDEYGGSYSVTETWILSKDPYIEDFSVSMRTSNQQGIVTISMDGNIRGLDNNSDTNQTGASGTKEYTAGYQGESSSIYNNSADGKGIDDKHIYNRNVNSKMVNALERFNRINFFQRAHFYLQYFLKENLPRTNNTAPFTTSSTYSDGTTIRGLCIYPSVLHPMPVSKSATINPVSGTVNYQVEFDNSPRTTIYAAQTPMMACGADITGAVDYGHNDPLACGVGAEYNIQPVQGSGSSGEGTVKPTESMELVDRGGFSGNLTSLEEARYDYSGLAITRKTGSIKKNQYGDLDVDCNDEVTDGVCRHARNEASPATGSSDGRLYARSENISVQWTGGNQRYSMTPVIGRNYPIAQNLGNREVEKLNVTIEAVMDISELSFFNMRNKPTNIESEIIPEILTHCGALQTRLPISKDVYDASTPYSEMSRMGFDLSLGKATAPAAKNFFIESDSESWNPRTGRYNRSITFVLKECAVKKTTSSSGGSG